MSDDDRQIDLEAHPELSQWAQRVLPEEESCAAVARHEQIERIRRGLTWFAAVVLLALMAGFMLGRIVNGPPPPLFAPASPQLLQVLAQQDAQHLQLQLQLDRQITYRRSESSGAVSFFLPDVKLHGPPQQGRLSERSLSWQVLARSDGVQVLLVGLGEPLVVRDQLEPVDEHWTLRLEVPLPASVIGVSRQAD